MSDQFIGELRLMPFGFAPTGWAACNGQLLPIVQYQALFSLLGTQYGGDGRTTFALPNLKGAVPLGAGPAFPQGQAGGEASVTLSANAMPAHSHLPMASSARGTQPTPVGGVWAEDSGGNAMFGATPSVTMNPAAIGPAGGSAPHNNMQPYLTLNWVIALQGIFPTRN